VGNLDVAKRELATRLQLAYMEFIDRVARDSGLQLNGLQLFLLARVGIIVANRLVDDALEMVKGGASVSEAVSRSAAKLLSRESLEWLEQEAGVGQQ